MIPNTDFVMARRFFPYRIIKSHACCIRPCQIPACFTLLAMKMTKPVHEFSQALFDGSLWCKSGHALELRTVGERLEHVDRPHWHQFALGTFANNLLQHVHKLN